ncbi:GntR family transcriptional regulator [Microcella pacifica]|uniref:GntR family transcriptional regulator n=1 Tax=Microcella pacifica TaxID=2591847 RepID=A0A9E5MEA7_9MICO|nr:GntR family transcriptional regulator [Microcella pacifica]NHF62342.1 GntR family transcriptional regulator [Microcella pacifica]
MARSAGSVRYLEIAEWLRELVFNAAPGARLPSDAEVAARFSVSRMTARSAIQQLVNENLIVRRQGAGTFTREAPLHRHEGLLMSFTADMGRRGLRASSRLITAELRGGSPPETAALRLPDGNKVVAIKRVRLADETPLALETAVIPPDYVSVLSTDLESGSLHDALTGLGHAPVVAHSWISSRLASASEAALLSVSTSEPLLVERRIVEDERGEPVEFTETAYIASRYVIDAVFVADTANARRPVHEMRHRPPRSTSLAQRAAPTAPE